MDIRDTDDIAADRQPGVVYGASNPFIPGMIKVGLTTSGADARRKTLSNTSVPGEFVIKFSFPVHSVDVGERIAHQALSAHRVDPRREFFAIDASTAANIIRVALHNSGVLDAEGNVDEPAQTAKPRRRDWEVNAFNRLHSDGVRQPNSAYLREIYEDARKLAGIETVGDKLAQDNIYHKWLNSVIDRGHLLKVQRDFYLNYIVPDNALEMPEIAHIFRPTAVISLQSVYGDSIGNNQSRMATCIIRSDSADAQRPRTIRAKAKHRKRAFDWEYRFYSMEPRLYEAGAPEVRLNLTARYPMATPERALCDMLVLSADGRNSMTMNAMFEADLSALDEDKMGRLVEAMGIQGLYNDFLAQVPNPEEDDEPDPSVRGFNW